MHPHLRLAASLIMAAGLVSACGGGGSGTPASSGGGGNGGNGGTDMQPTTERDPAGCTNASPTCTVTVTGADGTTTRTVTINMRNAAMMTHTRTVTVGTVRTITVRSTNPAHSTRLPIEVRECTVSGDACTLTKLTTNVYTGSDPVVTTVTTYGADGRPSSRMVGDLTTDIEFSTSGGGRTETTMKTGGELVQTFSQFTGGTATSTTFTSTDGNTVTRLLASGMREETVTTGGMRTRVTTGTPAEDADIGFDAGEMITITTYRPTPAAGTGIVAETRTQAAEVDGTRPAAVLTRQTRIITAAAEGETTPALKITYWIDADGMDDGVAERVEYDADDATTTTTTYNTGGTVTGTTVMVTDDEGEVTTTVSNAAAAVIRIVVTSSDGSTVATTGGPAADTDAGDPMEGRTVSVKTNSDGTKVTETFTGTGMTRVVHRRVTTDELGVERMRVVYSGTGNSMRVTTTTAYMPTGGSTVTTVTATRGGAETAESDYKATGSVKETKDARGRETKRETMDKDGVVTATRNTVYDPVDGSSVATTELPLATGDNLRDINIVTRGAPEGNALVGDIVSDVVVNPGVQLHTSVSEPQYNTIQEGMAARPNAKTVMGQAILHLNYANSRAFDGFTMTAGTVNRDAEVEVITTDPSCTENKCTYNDLRHSSGISGALRPATEMRLFTSSDSTVVAIDGNGLSDSLGAWAFPVPTDATSSAATRSRWDNNMGSRNAKVVMHQLLADLLNVGGAGAKATYTDPTAGATGYLASDPPFAMGVTGPKVEVESAAATSPERKTFTYLTETGLPVGVLGIGQQAKRVDSYKLLGGTRDNDPDDPAAGVAVPVRVTVENYFGWMKNSMFTVRRVVATGVTGSKYDWVHDRTLNSGAGGTVAFGATPTTVRAYFGMVSGTPSDRPSDRSTESMIDPGTWTGTMIGVGSVQGERYRGRAKVTVDFNNNNVTTAFDQINLAQYSDADFTENLNRFAGVPVALRDGIEFTNTSGITNDGSYTSDTLEKGFADDTKISSLSAQFYGSDAAEVAGTFNAHQMALGKPGSETANRGDLVGAFGAARDPMTARPADN